ncbi:FAD-binding oxidoreductase [Shimia sediminis]|uniref:FAD-binding oxidoreductase n=1 Tax=Shimia sediminis TaxID=2497945 RepID=UPI001F1F5384|nr:FAD-binding oxidoreductase [Shimia sediminis]
MDAFITALTAVVGPRYILSGDAPRDSYDHGWLPQYHGRSHAVVRPGSTDEVAGVLALANDHTVPIIPMGGNTGLTGATFPDPQTPAVILSLDRMDKILEIKPEAQVMRVQAGAILDTVRAAADEHNLTFPLVFGARGSCRIGGNLATNAGGSNVLRYGNARDLCLGLTVVLADGRVMDLNSELRKDNTGYDLKHLFIGSEGTLGVITEAILRLAPKPRDFATAMIAMDDIDAALSLLNRLNRASGGAVEAFELMPQNYCALLPRALPALRPVFTPVPAFTILVELAMTRENDDLLSLLEEELAQAIEQEQVSDAVIAQNESQRAEMWQRRESTFEVADLRGATLDTDIALPLDKVAEFLQRAEHDTRHISPQVEPIYVAHLGDGNVHYSLWNPPEMSKDREALVEAIEDLVADLGGSFSAEHGIGLMKRSTMARRKDPIALEVMHGLKRQLDPKGIMNPGKLLPDAP